MRLKRIAGELHPEREPVDLPASPDVDLDSVAAFGEEVARLREAAFALTDAARQVLGHGFTGVHVHLQTAANELGELERLLAESRLGAASAQRLKPC